MITKEYIDKAIEKTLAGESNLTDGILNIRGFSTPTIRRLINNLTNFECTYLEAGVLMGGTFVSSFNEKCTSIGFEDFSQNLQADIHGYTKEELEENIEKNRSRAKEIYMHHTSYLESDKSLLPGNINIFFADFEHGLECQSVALPEIFDNMANIFLFVVDDAQWETVIAGTGVGFKFIRKKMWLEKTWELRNENEKDTKWGQGVNLYLISKKQ